MLYIIATPFFPTPTSWRGAYCYDFVVALQRQLREGNSKRRVVVMKEGDGFDYEVGGVKVYTFKVRRLPSNIFPFLFKRHNQKSFLIKIKEVLAKHYALSAKHGLDLVEVCHCHTANYGIYAEAMKLVNLKCKTLLHHHDLQSFGLNNGALRHCWLYNMIQFPILRRMHEKIDTHVFISEAVRRSFLAAPDTSWTEYGEYKKQMRWLPYRPVKIKGSIILHNGVDKSIFYSNHQSPITNHCFTIGCVGNFSKLKGQDVLLRAVARLKAEGRRLKVRFVGSGETLEECKKFAVEKKIDAEFLTERRHEELPDFYRSLDLFVLPSKFEGFGCVYTEAHACGVPFIACEGQGIEDIIRDADRKYWLCRSDDVEGFAQRISSYIRNRQVQVLSQDQDETILVGDFIESVLGDSEGIER